MILVFGYKNRAVHARRAVNIDGGHAKRLESHCLAPVRVFRFISDVEMPAGKAVYERSLVVFFIGHKRCVNPFSYFSELLEIQRTGKLPVGLLELVLGRVNRDRRTRGRLLEIAGQCLPYLTRLGGENPVSAAVSYTKLPLPTKAKV